MSNSINTHDQEAKSGFNHIAGPLVNGVQRCTVCGGILSDYRNAAVEEGTPPLRGWPKGPVMRIGNMMAACQDDSLPDCDA